MFCHYGPLVDIGQDFLCICIYLKLEVPFLSRLCVLVFSFAKPAWILWSVHLSTGPVSHEQKLSQSLEIALTSTLGSMPSFTARLTRGQLQHLSTRGSSTSRRPGPGSGNTGPVHLLGALEWEAGPCLWGSVVLRPSS